MNPFSALTGVTRLHGVGALVAAFAVTSLAQWVLQTTWVLYGKFKFGWGTVDSGLSLFVAGVVALVVQGGLLGRLLRALGERRLILAGMLSSTVAFACYGLAYQGWMMYAIIACNFLAQCSIVTIQGIVSKAAGAEEQGRVLATLSALASLMVVFGPIIGNSLLAQVSHLPATDWRVGAPFFAASLLQALALLIAWRHFAAHRAGANTAASMGQPGT